MTDLKDTCPSNEFTNMLNFYFVFDDPKRPDHHLNLAFTWICNVWQVFMLILLPFLFRKSTQVLAKIKQPSFRDGIDYNETFCVFSVQIIRVTRALIIVTGAIAIFNLVGLNLDLQPMFTEEFKKCEFSYM